MPRTAANNPVVKTIHFMDFGQDFLSWGLDRKGYIRVCEPAQGLIWCGRRVVNHDSIRVGDHAELRSQRGIKWVDTHIKYPVVKVDRHV